MKVFKLSSSIKAFLFDLDGTLFDTAPQLCEAVNQMLVALNLPELESSEISKFIGKGALNLVAKSIEKANIDNVDLDMELAFDYFQNFYMKNAGDSQAYDGVMETLLVLKNRGYQLACVTNKPSKFTNLILEKNNSLAIFDYVVCGDEMLSLKPDPFSIQYVCEKLGIKTSEALMVGDSNNDIDSAYAAGAKMAFVPYGYQSQEKIKTDRIDQKINSIKELENLIG